MTENKDRRTGATPRVSIASGVSPSPAPAGEGGPQGRVRAANGARTTRSTGASLSRGRLAAALH